MIRLTGLGHSFRVGAPIFQDVTVDIPSDRRVALLGGLESGKTTLLNLIAGFATPELGRIERFCRVSFPASYQRGFRPSSTGRQNVEFAAKIYGADPDEVFTFVARVTAFGDLMELPMKEMSVQERITLGFALTYAIPFDTYLFDNAVSFGQPEFRERCLAMYEARSATAGTIVATRHVRVAEQLCDCAIVIRNRNLTFFDDLVEGIAAFEAHIAQAARIEGDGGVLIDEEL